ncbi:MAG: cytochrome c oxidase subunit II [Gammaproteobacteria bacterium HGW-Gammaproteobacteria-14]|nr:MAG: cytochrome c oxidase subunit II [Gammaproteobacteria bacterium HGW-Gammaproteobacteria-14]
MQSTLFRRVVSALSLLLVSGAGVASDWADRSNLNLRPGVTEISQDVFGLHMTILWVVTVIGLLVFGLIMYSAVAHRRSKNPNPSQFHEHVGLEVFWTVVPFFILIAMAFPATRVLISMDDTSDAELTIKVTGYRWNWSYEYLAWKDDNDIGVFFFSNLKTPPEQYERPILSGGLFPHGTAQQRVDAERPAKDADYMLAVDRPLVIPAGIKVRFLITADDVIHSWFMPDFAIKKDAIPGFINEVWTVVPEDATGVYYGQCAELCGRNHAFMPIEVHVVPQDEFETWIAEEKEKAASGPDLTPFASLDVAMQLGQEKYAAACALCHGANGQGGIGLPFAGTDFMKNPERLQDNIDVLIKGRNAMPAFAAQLTPREIAAVITYQRNAFGNETGDLVQPADVAK